MNTTNPKTNASNPTNRNSPYLRIVSLFFHFVEKPIIKATINSTNDTTLKQKPNKQKIPNMIKSSYFQFYNLFLFKIFQDILPLVI